MDKTFTFKEKELRLTEGFIEIDMKEVPYNAIERVTFKHAAFGVQGELRIKPQNASETRFYFKGGINEQILEIAAHIVKKSGLKLNMIKKSPSKLPFLLVPLALIIGAVVFFGFFWENIRDRSADGPDGAFYGGNDFGGDDFTWGDILDIAHPDYEDSAAVQLENARDAHWPLDADDLVYEEVLLYSFDLTSDIFIDRLTANLAHSGISLRVEIQEPLEYEREGHLVYIFVELEGATEYTYLAALEIDDPDQGIISRIVYTQTLPEDRLGALLTMSALVSAAEPGLAGVAAGFVFGLMESGQVEQRRPFGSFDFTLIEDEGGFFMVIEPH